MKNKRVSQLLQQGQRMGQKQPRNRFVVKANAKEIAFDQKSRSAMQSGIDKLANAVGLTLGPRGKLLPKLVLLAYRDFSCLLQVQFISFY